MGKSGVSIYSCGPFWPQCCGVRSTVGPIWIVWEELAEPRADMIADPISPELSPEVVWFDLGPLLGQVGYGVPESYRFFGLLRPGVSTKRAWFSSQGFESHMFVETCRPNFVRGRADW